MHTKRIIPCLDVNNGRVVKGTNFVNLKDAGDPVEVGREYDVAGADELVFTKGSPQVSSRMNWFFWILQLHLMPETLRQIWSEEWRKRCLFLLL